jgi:hypothetical protein
MTNLYVRAEADVGDALLISGETGEATVDIPIDVQAVEPGIALDKLFGYFNLRDIEDRISIAPEEETPALRARAIRLSIQSAIVSQFTGLCTIGGQQPMEMQMQPQPQPMQRQSQTMPMQRQSQAMPMQRQPQIMGMLQQPMGIQPMTIRQRRAQGAWEQREQGVVQVQAIPQAWGQGQPQIQQARMQVQPIPQAWGQGQPQIQQVPKGAKASKQFCRQRGPQQIAPPPQLSPQLSGLQGALSVQPVRGSPLSLQEIIALQRVNGSWNADAISRITPKTVDWEKMPQLAAMDLELRSTLCALAILERRAKKMDDVWKLVADKAYAWLKSRNPGEDWSKLVNVVGDLLGLQ